MADETTHGPDPPSEGLEHVRSPPAEPAEVRRLASRLRVRAADVDDVVQDALERVWRNGGTVERAGLVRSLRQIAREYRRRARRGELAPVDPLDVHDDRAGPEADAIVRSFNAFLRTVLLPRMKPHSRRVLVLHALEGFSLGEIATVEGISMAAAKKRLQRAKEELVQIRKQWQQEQEENGRPTTYAVVPPVLDLRGKGRRRLAFLRRLGFRNVAHGVLVAAVVLNTFAPATWSPFRPAPQAARSDAPACDAPLAVALAPAASESPPTAPVPAATVAPADVDNWIVALEARLIGQARVALQEGGPAGKARALALLRRHELEFPNGRHAAERDALLRRILMPYDGGIDGDGERSSDASKGSKRGKGSNLREM